MKFSERIGARAVPQQIQLESMNDALRNSLWNEILSRFGGESQRWVRAISCLGQFLFKLPVDSLPDVEGAAHRWMRDRFFAAPWDEVYDIVEFLVNEIDNIWRPETVYQTYYQDQHKRFLLTVNHILERELSGYRFVQGVIVPISDPAEILAIEQASQNTQKRRTPRSTRTHRPSLDTLGSEAGTRLPKFHKGVNQRCRGGCELSHWRQGKRRC